MALLEEELTHTRALVKEGYTPRNRQLELERMLSDANGSVAELLGNIARAQSSIGEVRQKLISRQQEYRKEVESQLSDVTREVQSDEGKFHAISDDLGRKNQTQLLVWVAGGKQPVSRNVERETLELIPDAKEYAEGQTAKLLVIAPWPNGEGLLTLRREGLAEVSRFKMQGTTHTLEIPITNKMLLTTR